MKLLNHAVRTVVIVGFLLTALSAQATVNTQVISQMVDLDQVIIPAASNSNQKNAEKTKIAVSRLQTQWSIFLASVTEAFPDDSEWSLGLARIDNSIKEVVKATEDNDFSKVHEILEDVRNTFEKLRGERNIPYYLDGFSRYRRVLEQTAARLAGKTAAELSEADLDYIASMVPHLKSAWISVQSAPLDTDLFHFDHAKSAEINSAMGAVQKSIDHLAAVSPGGNREQVFEAVNRLKPALKKAFLMFGKF